MKMSNSMLLSAAFLSLACKKTTGSFVNNSRFKTNHRTLRSVLGNTVGASPFSMLDNKVIVSVEDCLEAFEMAKESRMEEDVNVVFVDGTWYHRSDLNGRSQFEGGEPRIPGARHFDMDDVSATKDLFPHLNPKGLPHMLPPKQLFAAAMDALDIRNSDHVVVYGRKGCIFTPRNWFVFRAMGHQPSRTHLMQGSVEDWIALGGDVETTPTTVIRAKDLNLERDSNYRAHEPKNIYDMGDVLQVVDSGDENTIIIDPRSSSFNKGHLPGAVQIPYSSLVEKENNLKMKPIPELQQIFSDAGIDVHTNKKILLSCGSGVSVCHVYLSLLLCGRNTEANTFIYDGSWSEWGSDPSTPKVIPDEN